MKTIIILVFFLKSFFMTALYSHYNQSMTSEWILFLALLITSIFYLLMFKRKSKSQFKY